LGQRKLSLIPLSVDALQVPSVFPSEAGRMHVTTAREDQPIQPVKNPAKKTRPHVWWKDNGSPSSEHDGMNVVLRYGKEMDVGRAGGYVGVAGDTDDGRIH
jgi:hypothetical protein